MALVKNRDTITQLTASGTSTTASTGLAAGILPVVSMRHSNGSGSITVAATAQVQYQLNGGSRWFAPASMLATFSTTTAATDDRYVSLPDAASAARIVYVAPTGATGPTLDAEVGSVTP